MRPAAFCAIALGYLAVWGFAQTTQERATGMEFVKIAPGAFRMGCSEGDTFCDPDEKPAHEVRITKAFEIGKYEVTQAQWTKMMGENPSAFKSDNRPVENVSWSDAQAFLEKLNARRDGYRYRLPSEAEWEYAARAGGPGEHAGELDAMAWYSGNATVSTQTVGGKRPNAWSLYDMEGNVWEWVQDWYGDKTYGPDTSDPQGPTTGEFRVLRGGAWGLIPYYVRLSFRDANVPTYKDNSIGFRCVRQNVP